MEQFPKVPGEGGGSLHSGGAQGNDMLFELLTWGGKRASDGLGGTQEGTRMWVGLQGGGIR